MLPSFVLLGFACRHRAIFMVLAVGLSATVRKTKLVIYCDLLQEFSGTSGIAEDKKACSASTYCESSFSAQLGSFTARLLGVSITGMFSTGKNMNGHILNRFEDFRCRDSAANAGQSCTYLRVIQLHGCLQSHRGSSEGQGGHISHLVLIVVIIVVHEVIILSIIRAQPALCGIRPQLHKI